MPVERGIKSEPVETPETSGPETGAELSDPFAVDLFAASRPAADAARGGGEVTLRDEDSVAPALRETLPGVAWHASLPQISREEARRSALVSALPPTLSADARAALARAIARLARAESNEVRLDVLGTREASLSEFAPPPASVVSQTRTAAPRLFLTFGVEPEGGRVTAALDAEFAAAIVDRLLGGEGAHAAPLRPLSNTERTVVEFFCLSAVRELNALAGEPLLRLESTGTEIHGAGVEPDAARVLVTTVRLALGQTVGLARLVFDDAALAALDVAANPLLARARGRANSKLDAYARVAADVPLRLVLGETQLTASDLAELERGDIVIVERASAGVGAGRVAGRLNVRAGAGRGFVVEGGAVASASRGAGGVGVGEAASLALVVESVSGGEDAREEGERVDMEDEGRNEGGTAEGAAALEGLLLTLHVELPARRISLEELSRLRAGQVLELGCRPTDPVELVADGRRVASGELVDIEGRLGVRVTRLLG
ncbi:MAG TPA: FliM/FliN family flagellar motor switch protein [Pyrinomonadaceae bacterium]|nr:FliM/FliN family flagellar motor switch protein [Pyrinomonadaceae bacterium]